MRVMAQCIFSYLAGKKVSPWGRVLEELVKKFHTFCETERFVIVVTRARQGFSYFFIHCKTVTLI
jgi:hypothetical protein